MEIDNRTSSVDNMHMISGYHNAGGVNISTDNVNAVTQELSSLASLSQPSPDSACKKPLFNVGKKKIAYEQCLKDSAAQQADTLQQSGVQALANANVANPQSFATITPTVDAPFLQTPAGMATVAVLAVAIAGGIFYAVKHAKKA
jgi:hypothetical protein